MLTDNQRLNDRTAALLSEANNALDSKGVSVVIEGITVSFPKQPYPCQIEYMKSCIQSLNLGENALLESPTGTGKTLSLLCSTLAWRQVQVLNHTKKKNETVLLSQQKAESKGMMKTMFQSENRGIHMSVPESVPYTIIYSSRTHSQLSQVAKELRSTNYQPKMSLLGSRDQLCINESLTRKLKGTALNHACGNKVSSHSCSYKNNLENYSGTKFEVLDIEDLVKLGKNDKICPYYYSRESAAHSEIVLLPYNYLLDANMRKKTNINWNNAIVIFDEAHNIEKVASDVASFSLTSTDIAACIEELQQVAMKLREKQSFESMDEKKSTEKKNKVDISVEGDEPSLNNVIALLNILFSFEKVIDNIQLSKNGIGKTPSCVLVGNWLVDQLESIGYLPSLSFKYSTELNNCATFLMDQLTSGVMENEIPNSGLIEPKLISFARAMDKVFRAREKKHVNDYKIYICEVEAKKTNTGNSFTPGITMRQHHNPSIRQINFWAFSPGIAIEELKQLGVRSIIMTSGTLSPMASFKDDLKVPFRIELENNHVINSEKQVLVNAISTGPNGKQLNSSYNNRESNEYKDELGSSILRICETMIGKYNVDMELHGGILVFFPSYGSLESAVDRWKATSLYQRLEAVGGAIICEPKGSGNEISKKLSVENDKRSNDTVQKISFFGETRPRINEAEDENGISSDMLQGLVQNFDQMLRENRRCIFLAVCRGKVSEGIDFNDEKGRVVIITGLPYAPYLDPWIVLKKQYLDDRIKSSVALKSQQVLNNANSSGVMHNNYSLSSAATLGSSFLQNTGRVVSSKPIQASLNVPQSSHISGQDWYNQSATRAVNQAIGRVIRHKNDWGCIFLLDDRFQQDRQNRQLSKWVRPRHKNYKDFNVSMQDFRRFISTAMLDPTLNKVTRTLPNTMVFERPFEDIPNYKNKQQQNIILKEKTFNEADLHTQGEGISFINPSLLLSQVRPMKPTNFEGNLHFLDNEDDPLQFMRKFSDSQADSSKVIENESQNTSNISIQSIFNRKLPVGDSSSSTSRSLSSDASKPHFSKNDLDSIVKLSSMKENSRSISSSNSSIPQKFGLSSAVGKKVVTKKAEDNLSSQASQASQASQHSFAIPNKMIGIVENNEFDISFLGDELIKSIKPNELKDIRSYLTRIRSKKLASVDEVHNFITGIIEKTNSNRILTNRILMQFKVYVPVHLKDEYEDVVNMKLNLLDQSQQKTTSDKSVKSRVSTTVAADELFDSDEIVNSLPSQGIYAIQNLSQSQSKQSSTKLENPYRVSKRAIQALDSLKKNEEVIPSSNKKSKLSDLCDGNLSKLKPNIFRILQPSDLKLKQSFLDEKSESKVSSKLKCLICLEAPSDPCAASCGHICCKDCWLIWMKKNASCPICRQEISISRLNRLIIK